MGMTNAAKPVVAARVAWAIGALLASGCDSEADATGQDVPPIIQSDPTAPTSPPVGSIAWIDADQPPRELEFAVVVLEEDVSRPLDARWRIVKGVASTPPAYTMLPLLAGGQRVRPVRIKVASSQLDLDECHRLELAVSGSFVEDANPNVDARALFDVTQAGKEQDLAKATWWIWSQRGGATASDEQKARLLERCGASAPDAG